MNQKPLKRCVQGWVDGKFICDSGFYAGRPPLSCDLNSNILEMLYEGIKKDVGTTEAENFVTFVERLEDLSASSFIVAFEKFWANNCSNTVVVQNEDDRNTLTARDDHQLAQGLAFLGTAMFTPKLSSFEISAQSWSLKAGFLQNHRKESTV